MGILQNNNILLLLSIPRVSHVRLDLNLFRKSYESKGIAKDTPKASKCVVIQIGEVLSRLVLELTVYTVMNIYEAQAFSVSYR